jgi:putative FmdB family regulatory protein
MPIYDYRCSCGERREEYSPTYTPAPPMCARCDVAMERLISGLGRLMGSGPSVELLAPVPTSWDGLNQGSRQATTYWRRELDRRAKEYGADARPTRGTPSLTCSGGSPPVANAESHV